MQIGDRKNSPDSSSRVPYIGHPIIGDPVYKRKAEKIREGINDEL